MQILNNKLIVNWNLAHNKVLGRGFNGIDIIRAEKWEEVEGNAEATTKYAENVNYLETHPQICTVVHPSAKHGYKVGDTLFVHYMAREWAEIVADGELIDTTYVLFKVKEDGSFEMTDKTYLGEEIYTEEEKTTSGIILGGGKKESLKIRITHLPAGPMVNIGDVVVSIDDKNYVIDYWGKKYVKLVEHEIVGVVMEVA